jgi:hypothetical protein
MASTTTSPQPIRLYPCLQALLLVVVLAFILGALSELPAMLTAIVLGIFAPSGQKGL